MAKRGGAVVFRRFTDMKTTAFSFSYLFHFRESQCPRVAQRDTHLTEMTQDLLLAMCRILSWHHVKVAGSLLAVVVKHSAGPIGSIPGISLRNLWDSLAQLGSC
jgi:hypothetical protein